MALFHAKLMQKSLVVGLGEIGQPILQLLSATDIVVGYDINPKLMNEKKYNKFKHLDTTFCHICIPFSSKFDETVFDIVKKHNPKAIVIHSTISPGTTQRLQKKLDIPVIYSATRGIHKRMLSDLRMYTKFYAIESDAPKKN